MQLVTGTAPWSSVLGPVLSNINGLEEEFEGTFGQFAHDIELDGSVNLLEGRKVLQKNLDKLNQWAEANHVRFIQQGHVLSPVLG